MGANGDPKNVDIFAKGRTAKRNISGFGSGDIGIVTPVAFDDGINFGTGLLTEEGKWSGWDVFSSVNSKVYTPDGTRTGRFRQIVHALRAVELISLFDGYYQGYDDMLETFWEQTDTQEEHIRYMKQADKIRESLPQTLESTLEVLHGRDVLFDVEEARKAIDRVVVSGRVKEIIDANEDKHRAAQYGRVIKSDYVKKIISNHMRGWGKYFLEEFHKNAGDGVIAVEFKQPKQKWSLLRYPTEEAKAERGITFAPRFLVEGTWGYYLIGSNKRPHFTLSYVKTIRRYPAGAFPGWELQLNVDSTAERIYSPEELPEYLGQKVLTSIGEKFPLFGKRYGATISLRLGEDYVDLNKSVRDKGLETLINLIYASLEDARKETEWLRRRFDSAA